MEKLVLKKEEYLEVCKKVWKRDKYKCRNPLCKKRGNFSPHHIIFRSHLRIDADWNLLTLCSKCHDMVHRNELKIINDNFFLYGSDFPEPTNANNKLVFIYQKIGKTVIEK